ncbi:MAG: methylated-DNA--[protein]-cysteine S-methyltransferase [Anaerolineales bacterium]|nr:methylated-DNA--[protein]-cysteine S-methyltransferase [Anaerolineales bacterium]MCW5856462.1 methylated-DNA--[protein]-cysteine S-methyltransferase [Anaerolineales bacterium]
MPTNPPSVFYDSKPSQKLGLLWAAVSADGVWAASYGIDEVEFLHHIQERGPARPRRSATQPAPVLRQMDQFLRGQRRDFDLPVDWSGMTPFQVAVRRAVMAVPYGQTASYGDIAAAVGRPLAARAVGGVQARNPISFLIPCHRIVGSDGSLHGYGGFGGLETKRWLLKLEGAELRKP